MVGIYKITNPKGKIYIGQSFNIEKRFGQYKRLNCKSQQKLYNSLKKYTPQNHTFEIIEECNDDNINEREIYWINFYECQIKGLNIREGGDGGSHSEETKRKMSESRKGYKWSNEHKQNYSNSKINHPMYNDEWKENISNSLIGRDITWSDKISKSKKGIPSPFEGKKHSKETKKKMSEYRKTNYTNEHMNSPILQYDKNNNFIKEWNSINEALQFHKGDISACCRGSQKTSAGFIWKYKNKPKNRRKSNKI